MRLERCTVLADAVSNAEWLTLREMKKLDGILFLGVIDIGSACSTADSLQIGISAAMLVSKFFTLQFLLHCNSYQKNYRIQCKTDEIHEKIVVKTDFQNEKKNFF